MDKIRPLWMKAEPAEQKIMGEGETEGGNRPDA
jgi:hypothetical protein